MQLPPLSLLLLIVGLTAVVQASPTPPTRSIDWYHCKQNASIPIVCGTLDVPLDYTKPDSNETITLQLVKVPALNQPSQGSILFNFGGPGLSSRNDLTGDGGRAFQLITGGHHDLVTWDPRGTGETLPFACPNTSLAVANAPSAWTASDTALGEDWAAKQVLAAGCKYEAGDIGELIGTAFTARDLMQIVDALNEDGLLRYWGFSYGTALGATVAATFPDRMDRIVLDGVLNMDEYYAGKEVQQVARSDATWAGFFIGCVKTPHLCPLASSNPELSADQLQHKVETLLKTTKYSPIALGLTIVDYNLLKQLIILGIYYPSNWPALATAFDSILTSNYTAFGLAVADLSGEFALQGVYPSYQGPAALQGIRCSDTSFRSDKLSKLMPILHEFKETSYILGDTESTSIFMSCAAWKMTAKEQYSGGFSHIRTKKPILFIGSPYDPLTPLPSTRNVSAAFEGSVVLQHNGYGHCSTSQPSLCTAKAIRSYFMDGSLPAPGTTCEPSVPMFRKPSLDLLRIVSPLKGTEKRSVEADDENLLAAMTHVGQRLSARRMH